MNLSKGHREVTVRFHGLCVKQTKGGKWIERGEGSDEESEESEGEKDRRIWKVEGMRREEESAKKRERKK